MNAERLFDDALALAKRPDASFLQLARSLAELRRKLPERFGDLIEQSGLNPRRAHYLREMAEHLARLETHGVLFDEDQLKRIGWGKLRVVARHLTPGNADKWLKLAEQHTIRELVARLPGERKPLKGHPVVLHFTAEQYQIFEDAVLQNGGSRKPKGRGLQNKEEAILKIIQQSRSSS